MKLNEMYSKPLKELLEGCNMVSIKPITDEKGSIIKFIIEYEPNTVNNLKEHR